MHAKTVAFAGLASVASAHMKMSNPVPFNSQALNNGPMDASGSDFPCKIGGGYRLTPGASNVYAQGSTQTLKLIGSAVHGGGSCQMSVTTDLNPTKSSVWKVIKSIEGGCPAKGQVGNMPDGGNTKDSYDFTIPKELAAGNYTLAWTWFNKVGNREMYMNCAPMTVTGSAGSSGFLGSLPDMFVANVNNGCSTIEGTDMRFPNPGQDVDNFGGSTMAAKASAPVTRGSCQAGNGGGSRPSKPVDAAPPKPTGGAGSPPVANPGVSPTKSVPGGVFKPTTPPTVSKPTPPAGGAPTPPPSAPEPKPSPPTPSQPTEPGSGAPPAPPAPPANPPAKPGNGGGNGGAGFAAGTACSSEGEWNCVGGKSFQRCASGTWSAVQPFAEGTSCAPGQSPELNMNVVYGSKRAAKGFSA
ncbi:Chitin-binding, domain 3 [Moelleriella libera RCEF 2490]|uniref:Chitin-binding, domain 3 n=1 Tax=Moelleriella libera RCEF 2490 TaxID=1081109 RepID=A0A168E4U0_9HYPO|nr:Chitin-binding, domain 3 [Moelleriella libera RCEF 2490]